MFGRDLEPERVKRIDRAFDLMLLLVSVIAAALFEYLTYFASTVEAESQVIINFRLLFFPLLLTAAIWLLMKIFIDNHLRLKMWMRILAWTSGINAFRNALFISLVLGFQPQGPIGYYSFSYTTILFLAGFLTTAVILKYTKEMSHISFFKTTSWFYQASLAAAIGIFVNGLLFIPIPFLGLVEYPLTYFLFIATGATLGQFFLTFFVLTMYRSLSTNSI